MDPADVRTLVDLFRFRVQSSKDAPAMLVKQSGEWRPIPWSTVETQVRGVAAGLAALGVKPGDRVAILSENRPEWVYADLGSLSAGAGDVPIYPTHPAKPCEF